MNDPAALYEQVLDLLDDGDYEQALAALKYLEGELEPHAGLICLRARLLSTLGRHIEAEAAAKEAVELAPEHAYPLGTWAVVALHMKDPGTAIKAAQRARALEPTFTEAALVEASAHALTGNWGAVERVVAQASELDPESGAAATLRAFMKELRGRGAPAAEWDELSQRFPLDPLARAGRGWSLLAGGEARVAEEEFRQALAIDPSEEWARDGLVAALKSRYPGYSALLRTLIALGRLNPRTRLFIILGGLFAFRALRTVARENPSLLPILAPFMALWAVFVLSSWLADPLLNLALLGTPEGRAVLSAEEKQSGYVVGGALGIAILAAVASFAGWSAGILVALAVAATSLTLAVAYTVDDRWRPRFLGIGAVGVVASVAGGFVSGAPRALLIGLPILVAIVSTWVGSAMSLRASTRFRR